MEEKILQILKERGMRMSNLAAKLGVDQSNLSKKLKNDPKVSLIERIAAALEVPVSSFFPEQLPTEPAGVLNMGGRRFALIPLPDEAAEQSDTSPEPNDLTPETLQHKIYRMALQCSKDGKTRAFYGFLAGHLVAVLHDSESKRYICLFGSSNGSASCSDYPSLDYEGWECIQLAELIVNDIISTCDL